MATSTVAAVTKMAHFLMAFTLLLSTAVADQATIRAAADLPDYFQHYMMTLSLNPAEAGPVPFEYPVVPLTRRAGLNVTNLNILNAIHVQGSLVSVDQTNFNLINDSNVVVYMSCDSNDATSNISPSDVLNGLMAMVNKPRAILLYTVTGTYCELEGAGLAYNSTWSMISSDDAYSALNVSQASTGTIIATLAANGTSNGSLSVDDGGGNNSAVAMSILYSITGLITLLFLIIIATGAIRAHRHPERYGPRAGLGGRSRQSRARGLARAVLETLPIVKFGDPHPAKGDPENELESVSGDRRLDSPEPVWTTSTNEAVAQQAKPAGEATRDAQMPSAGTESDTRSTKSGERVDDEHLGCTICTEDFAVGDDVRVLPCDHKFHPPCIDPWLVNVSGTCPLCRLDLRPAGSRQEETTDMPERQTSESLRAPDRELPEELNDPEVAQSRRISRLLDWNRLRHASVDERIQALRQIREQQEVSAPVEDGPAEDGSQHARLTDRFREKFHIRTRTQS